MDFLLVEMQPNMMGTTVDIVLLNHNFNVLPLRNLFPASDPEVHAGSIAGVLFRKSSLNMMVIQVR